MKSLFLGKFLKIIPVYLIAAVILASLTFSLGTTPEWKQVQKLQKSLRDETARFESTNSQLRQIQALPAYDFALEDKGNTSLMLKYLLGKKGFSIQNLGEGADSVNKYVEVVVATGGEKSILDTIVFLEKLRTALPIAYTKYEASGRSLKFTARCYFDPDGGKQK